MRIFKGILLVAGLVLIRAQPSLDVSRHNAITRAIEKVSPAVASIEVTFIDRYLRSPFFQDPFFQYFFPPEVYQRQGKNTGSGVVISPDGYLLTNYHVVENASQVAVTLPGGKEYEAEIVGSDPVTDLALLKLAGSQFPYADLGDSDQLIIGEWVVALGNPFGLFDVNKQPTATAGIVSAVNLDFGLQTSSGQVFQDMIQTDAAINPGNSGGPLVNARGEVIGVNTFIFTGSDYTTGSIGISFAIPINRARRIAEELKHTGRIDRSFATGLTVQALERRVAAYLELPFQQGIMITEVESGSAADKAGLEVGDIIVEVGGKKVASDLDIRRIIRENDMRPGDKMRLLIYRDGRYRTVGLRLSEI